MKKKAVAAVLAAGLVTAAPAPLLATQPALAAEASGGGSSSSEVTAAEAPTSGNCGATESDQVTWALTQNPDAEGTYTLTISGLGQMKSWAAGSVLTYYKNDTPYNDPRPWDAYNESITSVVIEGGVTKVGDSAFLGLINLNQITFANTVEEIGQWAFGFCRNLPETIKLPASLKKIDYAAFKHVSGLKEITLPEGLKQMGNQVFLGGSNISWPMWSSDGSGTYSTSLQKVDFSKCQISSVPNGTFMGCEALEEVILPDAVSVLGTSVFKNCVKLSKINTPLSLKTIGDSCFSGCKALRAYTINEGSAIVSHAFEKSGLAGTVVIPSGVTMGVNDNWAGSQFQDCKDITGIIVEGSDVAIPNGWCSGCGGIIAWDFSRSNVLTVGNFSLKVTPSSGVVPVAYVSSSTIAASNNDNLMGKDSSHSATNAIAVTNGGTFEDGVVFEAGKFATPVKEGCDFVNWYEKENFSGIPADAPAAGKTYYAKFTYTITFDGNGADGGTPTAEQVVTDGVSATLAKNTFAKSGYEFGGWNTKADGTGQNYADGAQVPAGATTLYAKWVKKVGNDTYFVNPAIDTVTYNGAEQKPAVKVQKGDGEFVEVSEENAAKLGYSLAYENNTDAGEATVTVKVGGEVIGVASFGINKAVYPVTLTADKDNLSGAGTVVLKPELAKVSKGVSVTDVICDDVNVTKNDDGTWSAELPNETATYTFEAVVTGAEKNYEDGSATCTVDVTYRAPVSPSTTVTTTVTNPDGSVTTTVVDKRTGDETVTTAYKDGTVVKTVKEKGAEPRATVTLPRGVASATVTLPVEAGAGTVAVDAKTGEPVELCAPVEGGLAVRVNASCELAIRDNAKSFSDVAASDWFAPSVAFASARGIMNGVGDTGLFEPEAPMTRAMAAQALWNLAGNPEGAAAPAFSDVPEGAWYGGAVAWAAESGVARGYEGAGLFGPDDGVTREQFAVMLLNYAKAAGLDTSERADLSAFSDAAALTYGEDAMGWAVAEGLFQGYEGTSLLGPTDGLTRAQCAALAERMVGLLVLG